jgi:aldehyde:ferredoxin oxidoreductase
MMRAFNSREGLTREHDVLPPKLARPRAGGPSDGAFIDPEELEEAKDAYYAMCGWDDQGCPTRAKLRELSVEWVADELGL